jgi:aryl-alcohol dehydrogenase-like predicted oxidoreductase
VTRVGLGLAALGRPAYITSGRDRDLPAREVDALRARAHDVLDAAYGAGVRHVDAARSYGRSEEFLAGWLEARGHPDVVVSSKWGYAYVGDWRTDADVHEVKDHSLAQLTRQWAETRVHLEGRVALYQIHSATRESGVLEDAEVLGALAVLRDSGVRVGLSTSGPAQADTVRAALGVRIGGAPLFSSVQSTWNLLEPSAGPALAEASEAGCAVIVKEGVANGRLTAAGDAGAQGSPLAVRAAELGTTPDALALAAALAQPWCASVLSGAVTVGQLRSNLAALDLAAASSAPEALDVPELAEEPWAYWAARSARQWT